METEIKELRVLLPALIEFNEEAHYGGCALVYIDQIKGDVIIPGESTSRPYILNQEAFTEAVRKYMIESVKQVDIPSVPREGFEKLDPESYMGDS